MQNLERSLFSKETAITVVGLGYVGLPLAAVLARKFKVIGFDINTQRIDELKTGHDRTGEVENSDQLLVDSLKFTANPKDLLGSKLFIVAVPTPVDEFKKPDLTPLQKASESVGAVLSHGAVVCYESTVYPGVTEGFCREHLEKSSGLKFGEDFFLGYSPERVNPGDKNHTIDKIMKVVSGSTPEVADLLAKVYGAVVTAGIFRAENIATAEAAKIIENTQRDVNIALVNELALIFDRLGLDSLSVLEAAGTKWNFLNFRPGLVGGHCIGVDPYYLTHLAGKLGYHPKVISSGRQINDSMGRFIGKKAIRMVLSASGGFAKSRIRALVLGVTFKENVPDTRNTKVLDIVEELEDFGSEVYLHDPVADRAEFRHEYHRELTEIDAVPTVDVLVLAVNHQQYSYDYVEQLIETKLSKESFAVIDVKGCFSRTRAKELGLRYWRL